MLLKKRNDRDWSGGAINFKRRSVSGQIIALEHRRVGASRKLLKTIGKPLWQDRCRVRRKINGNALHLLERDNPQVINAVGLVRVVVGDDHGVNRRDRVIDQLLAHIRRRIDEQRGEPPFEAPFPISTLNNDGAPRAPVFRFMGVAYAPITPSILAADTGYTA